MKKYFHLKMIIFLNLSLFLQCENNQRESSIFSSFLDVIAYGYVATSEKSSKESKKEAIINAVTSAQEIVSEIAKNNFIKEKRSINNKKNIFFQLLLKKFNYLIVLKIAQPDQGDV